MRLHLVAIPLCLLLSSFSSFAQCTSSAPRVGTAYVNNIINWSQTGDLYFTVTGAPPNVCGALDTIRNGSCLYTPGWICTDANGNAFRGPWRWVDQPNDQTDTDIHFDWPNGTATYFTTNHYWDKTCPTPTITSATDTPPASFYGTGDDGYWGAGFGNWTSVKLQFQDTTTGYYWNPSTGDYTAPAPPDIFATITSGLGTIGPGTADSPSYHMTWNGSGAIPYNHQPLHSYAWNVVLKDGDTRCQESAPTPITFTMPQAHICEVESIDTSCPF
jgi:hypothetical protein